MQFRLPSQVSVVGLLLSALACGSPQSAVPEAPTAVEPQVPEAAPEPIDIFATVPAPVITARSEATSTGDVVLQVRNYIGTAVLSPEGSIIAMNLGNGVVALVDPITYQVRAQKRLWVRQGTDVGLQFDRSGTRLLVHGTASMNDSGEIYVWDLHQDTLTQVYSSFEYYGNAALSPDGRTVVWGVSDREAGHLYFHDLSGETPVRTVDTKEPNIGAISYSPSGNHLFVAEANRLKVRDAKSGELIAHQPDSSGLRPGSMVTRPTGGAFAILKDGEVELKNPADGSTLAPLIRPLAKTNRDELPKSVHWSPDGQHLVTQSKTQWVAFDAQTQNQLGSRLIEKGEKVFAVSNTGIIYSHRLKDGQVGVSHVDFTNTETPKSLWVDAKGGYRHAASMSADGNKVILQLGESVATIDLQSSTVVGSMSQEHQQVEEKSIWGLETLPTGGFMSWARSGVETWGPRGAILTSCYGRGKVVELGGVLSSITSGGVCPLVADGKAAPIEGNLVATDADQNFGLLIQHGRTPFIVIRDLKKAKNRKPVKSPENFYCNDCANEVVLRKGGKGFAVLANQRLVIFRTGKKKPTSVINDQFRALWLPPNEKHLMGVRGDGVSLFDWRGRELSNLTVPVTSGVSASRNEKTGSIVIASETKLTVFDQNGNDKATIDLSLKYPPKTVLSHDDKWLLIHTEDKSQMFNLESGQSTDLSKSSAVFSPSATQLARCEAGKLILTDLASKSDRRLGPCVNRNLRFSEDSKFLAMTSRVATTAIRIADGQRMVMRKIVSSEKGRKTYWMAVRDDGAYQSNAPSNLILRRGAGSLATAPLSDAGAQTDTLLETFFAGN